MTQLFWRDERFGFDSRAGSDLREVGGSIPPISILNGGLAQMVERSLSIIGCYSSEAELPAAVRMVRGSIPRGTFLVAHLV